MNDLLQMIADGDYFTPIPRCGALLRVARELGYIDYAVPVPRLTPAGRARLELS